MTIEFVSLKAFMPVSQAFERIRKFGIDKETIYTCYVTDEINKLIGVVTAKNLLLEAPDAKIGDIMLENVIYAYVILFMLYFALIICGQYIVTSIIREKSTKAMELLITSCKSWKLINGKVLGVGLAGLTQFALMVAATLLSMTVNGMVMAAALGPDAASTGGLMSGNFQVAVQPQILTLMVVFFMLGYFAYSYMYAALASTVDRMEDANAIVGLPMMLIVGSFLAANFGLMSPGAGWVVVLSYVPFFTPMVMFTRICLGAAAQWEIWLSILLQLAIIPVMGWLGAKIYRMGTLMYGNKPGFKNIIAAFRHNR
jgi:ABC-2 type transport system permease protein